MFLFTLEMKMFFDPGVSIKNFLFGGWNTNSFGGMFFKILIVMAKYSPPIRANMELNHEL